MCWLTVSSRCVDSLLLNSVTEEALETSHPVPATHGEWWWRFGIQHKHWFFFLFFLTFFFLERHFKVRFWCKLHMLAALDPNFCCVCGTLGTASISLRVNHRHCTRAFVYCESTNLERRHILKTKPSTHMHCYAPRTSKNQIFVSACGLRGASGKTYHAPLFTSKLGDFLTGALTPISQQKSSVFGGRKEGYH